jgi:chromosome segregation ATPase
MMPNSRHAIADFIQPQTRKKPNLQLDEAANNYREASEILKKLQEGLENDESLLVQKSKYLKELLRNEITAKHEIPSLKKELLTLKNKLVNLSFQTQQWGETCQRQEAKIEVLLTKKSNLSHKLSAIQRKQESIDKDNLRLENERRDIENNIEKVRRIRDEIELFDDISPCQHPSSESKKLTSADLVSDVNTSLTIIKSNIASKEQTDNKISTIAASISKHQNDIKIIEDQIKTSQAECNDKNSIITELDSNSSSLTQQISELKERYQTYYEILSESEEVVAKRNSLIDIVNDENSQLKESLLHCNKLEMTLRLEELQMTVFLKEMERLDE